MSSQKGEPGADILRRLCAHVTGMNIFTLYLEVGRDDLASLISRHANRVNLKIFQRLQRFEHHILIHLNHFHFRLSLNHEVVSSRSTIFANLSEPHVTQTGKHLE
jgi:hypothetical protein